MELLAKLVLVVLAVGAVWWLVQPRYTFVVRIDGGVPRVTNGQVTAAFLQELGRACGEFAVCRGWVGGVRRGGRTALAFSRNLPQPCRQRVRNLWELHG